MAITSLLNESNINSGILDVVGFESESQVVKIETDQFMTVCPFSKYPDISELTITYRATDKIIELRSLKDYLMGFRDVAIYQEPATKRIYDDLAKLLNSSNDLEVMTVCKTRDGFDTTCTEGAIKANGDSQ